MNKFIVTVILSLAVLIIVPTLIIAASSADLSGNGKVDLADFNLLVANFHSTDTTKIAQADINNDNKLDLRDYNLLISNYGSTVSNQASSLPSPSASPAQSSSPVAPSSGIWISHNELMRLPTAGAAWSRLLSKANSDWGSACLHDNNCEHDVSTMAGALVAARTNDAAMRNKVIAGLQSAMNSQLARALELSRGLQTYIISADLIGYHDPAFESWVRSMLNTNVSGHSGDGVLGTAYNSSNNWGGHARASVAAAAVYLNDATLLAKVATAFKAFIGLPAPGNTMVYSSTTWHADSGNKAGVNRKGATIDGKNVSGALPEDWRRASTNFVWPPATTGYMWEGMQGYIATAVILHRAGVVPFTAADNAVMRAMDALYSKGEAAANNPSYVNPASSDDTWIPWVVNYYLGENRYPTTTANPGKNIGWTDWTHPAR